MLLISFSTLSPRDLVLGRAWPAGLVLTREVWILAPKGCSFKGFGLCSYTGSTEAGRDLWKSSQIPCSSNVRWSSLLVTVSN